MKGTPFHLPFSASIASHHRGRRGSNGMDGKQFLSESRFPVPVAVYHTEPINIIEGNLRAALGGQLSQRS